MHPPDPERVPTAASALARAGWVALGSAFVGLGALGVVLPGLPTTPFLLLAAACFVRGSRRLYERLLAHRVFGPLIRDYREGRGVPRRVKVLSIGTMWVFVLFALGPGLPAGLVVVRGAVAVAALIGTLVLLRLPTRRAEPQPQRLVEERSGERAEDV